MSDIVVFDYGVGNVRSVVRMCEKAGADVVLSSDKHVVLGAAGLIVPGVGDFDTVVKALRDCGGEELIRQRLVASKAVFGICVGLQIMFSSSEERGSCQEGLGFYSGHVKALQAEIVPHMGWSKVFSSTSRLLRGLDGQRFYFAHSYAVPFHEAPCVSAVNESQPPVLARSVHGNEFVAAIEDGPLCATQFHPEKSGICGERVIRNWLTTIVRQYQ
ncbi:MAG: imidazole glycerol phosphate synthase subunit HisH [Actinomycetaceae bacterium]|nr:imidazole glycerol phosphate synthase subunit HisH [Actinomycetaceae bacterium]